MFRTPTLWKYTVREVQRRPGRTLLTLLGIVIGVATIVAVTATTRATRRSYQGMFDPAPVLRTVETVNEIEAAASVIQNRAGLQTPQGTIPVLVLGIDPAH